MFRAILFCVALIGIIVNAKTTCGGNCPTGCDTCPCGDFPPVYLNVSYWCAQYTWNQKNCECIVQHESGGNFDATNENADGSYDVGLWQINQQNWKACNDGNPPCGPNHLVTENLGCAEDVYKWGDNTWKYWATCDVYKWGDNTWKYWATCDV
eukprot:321236_1